MLLNTIERRQPLSDPSQLKVGPTTQAAVSTVSAFTSLGAHGVIRQQEFAALDNTSVCQLAVGRIAVGGPAIGLLGQSSEPLLVGHDRPADERCGQQPRRRQPLPRRIERDDSLPGEPLERYLERTLRQATILVLPNRTTSFRISKRVIDVVGAVILLLVTFPIMLALAALIRLDSDGPAIFRQTRVTRGGQTFRFYKFRTMYVDARERFPDLYNYDFSDGDFDSAYYKLADDPRNTRVGRWLRRTTLDELPNLFNVLKGDLSLVGPRPELPELVRYYEPENLACLFTKAGLTGLAQVAGRSLLTVRERLTLDTRYVANQTLLLDVRILARTVLVMITGRGAF